jgi:hypothetical protein
VAEPLGPVPAILPIPPTGSTLTCTPPTWKGDLPESHLCRAPQSFTYIWLREGIPAATTATATFVATQPGYYSCRETGTNGAGSTTSDAYGFWKVVQQVTVKRCRSRR